jgi:hypothetical protein
MLNVDAGWYQIESSRSIWGTNGREEEAGRKLWPATRSPPAGEGSLTGASKKKALRPASAIAKKVAALVDKAHKTHDRADQLHKAVEATERKAEKLHSRISREDFSQAATLVVR